MDRRRRLQTDGRADLPHGRRISVFCDELRQKPQNLLAFVACTTHAERPFFIAGTSITHPDCKKQTFVLQTFQVKIRDILRRRRGKILRVAVVELQQIQIGEDRVVFLLRDAAVQAAAWSFARPMGTYWLMRLTSTSFFGNDSAIQSSTPRELSMQPGRTRWRMMTPRVICSSSITAAPTCRYISRMAAAAVSGIVRRGGELRGQRGHRCI